MYCSGSLCLPISLSQVSILFIIQLIFIEHLPHVRHYSNTENIAANKKTRSLTSKLTGIIMKTSSLEGDLDIISPTSFYLRMSSIKMYNYNN